MELGLMEVTTIAEFRHWDTNCILAIRQHVLQIDILYTDLTGLFSDCG